jgi:hypothetical protein
MHRIKYLSPESICFKVVLCATILSSLSVVLALPQTGTIYTPSPGVYATTEEDNDADQQDEEDQQQEQDDSASTPAQPQVQGQSQPQTEPQTQGQQPQAQLEDFIVAGKINSLLPVGNNTWISDGSWNMVVESGDPKSFNTHMIWTSADGISSHTHDFMNLELSSDSEGIVMSPTDTQLLQGEVDVATNGAVEWQGVPAAIYIGNGKTIAMTVDDAATNSHFGGQPIYGLVTSFTPCGASGPNMEVSPSCE